MRHGKTFAIALLAALGFASQSAHAIVRGKPVHALALYGEPKFGPDFKNFDFVNPDAPKGGTIHRRALGTFDTFNAFSFKGNAPPPGIIHYMGNGWFFLFNEPLMVHGADEPFTEYCLICETVELAEDNSWIAYTLRPEARFHDGAPVTPEDVIFSLETLMAKGHPRYKLYWGDIAKAEKTGERSVKFTFKTNKNNELPLLTGQIPVLNKKFWTEHDIQTSTLDVPVATGPYRIDSFEQGRYFVLKRDPNYWGKDLPVTRGAFNFDEMRVDYYRDDDVSFRAFLAGDLDIFVENDITRWVTGYDKNLVDAGALKKQEFRDGQSNTTHPFVMNLRREKFADRRVRQAISLAFDFDASNKTVGYGLMAPVTSFFQGMELASNGLPSAEELAILEKYRGQIPDEVFTTPFEPPRTNRENGLRDNLLKAQKLLADAGWEVKDGVLKNAKTDAPFEFEVLMLSPSYERWVGPYLGNLARIGIKATIRQVDPAQYLNRVNERDFDMVVPDSRNYWGGQSDSPGNEQREQWGTDAADRSGSDNWPGLKNPAVDALIEELIRANSRESLVTYTHALDRVLLWSYLVVPSYGEPNIRWAYWSNFEHPEKTPRTGPNPVLWWTTPAKASEVAAIRDRQRTGGTSEQGGSLTILALVAAAGVVVVFLVVRRRRASH